VRLHIPGVPVHVLSRGNDKQCIFTDNRDYERYLQLLSDVCARFGVTCHAFCLLWNHLHLIVTPSDLPVCGMMRQLNSHYCQWFNHRHGRVGHVLQGRYRALLIDGGSYFLNAMRYVVLNPVAAHKVKSPADWPWSSYRATVDLEERPAYLDLQRLWHTLDAADASNGCARFKALVEEGGQPEELWGPLFVGSEQFARRIDPLLDLQRSNRDFLYAERFATRPPLTTIFTNTQMAVERERAAFTAFCRHAYTLREIGERLGRHPSTIWTWVHRAQLRRRCEMEKGDLTPVSPAGDSNPGQVQGARRLRKARSDPRAR